MVELAPGGLTAPTSISNIMELPCQNTYISDQNTPPKQFGGGPDTQFTTDSWDKLAVSQCRLEMLRILVKSDIGLNEVEEYNTELNLKLKSKALRDRGPLSNRGVVRQAMRQKLQDEVRLRDECTRDRDKMRRLIKSIYGFKSTTTKAIIKKLKTDSDKVRVELRQKYLSKIAHLKRKFEKRRVEEKANKPAKLHGFEDAKVFSREFDSIVIDDITVSKVGKIVLSGEEMSALRIHPKFAVREVIDEEEVEFQEELGWAKLRFKLLKEEEERLDSDVEDDLMPTEDDMEEGKKFAEMEEILEAKSRQYYDPEGKIFNYGKKRATDLKENSRVTLPKPCSAEDEAGIEIRRKSMKTTLRNFKLEKRVLASRVCKED